LRAGDEAYGDGTPLDAATYSVAVNGFLADGGDGFTALLAGTDRWQAGSISTRSRVRRAAARGAAD
jgi:hypothetical protein